MTPTNHSPKGNSDHLNKMYGRSKKRQAYFGDEYSSSGISSEHDDDRENDTDVLVEVYYLSKKSNRKAIPSE
jgi:hypothetical protein